MHATDLAVRFTLISAPTHCPLEAVVHIAGVLGVIAVGELLPANRGEDKCEQD